MSNLLEITGEINDILEHDPKLSAYKDATARVVNAKYLEINTRHPWSFLNRWKDIIFYAKVTGSASATVSIAPSTRLVIGVGTAFASHYEGHVFTLGGNEYRIVSVVNATNMYIDATVSAGVTNSAAWSVTFRKYAFPADMDEPLGIVDRSGTGMYSRFTYMDARTEEDYNLNEADSSGDPEIYIEDETENDQAPDDPPLATLGAGGTLEPRTEYEYCYTIVALGRESPPSLIVSAKTDPPTGARFAIALTLFEDLRLAGGIATGRYKYLYRRKKTNQGRWLRLATLTEAVTVYLDNGSVTPSKSEADVLREAGPRPYFRPWYIPVTDTTVRLRYTLAPRRLQNDADVPIWPVAYHRLLVHEALVDIAGKHGANGLADRQANYARVLMDRMKMKCLARTDRQIQRKGFDTSPTGERWGVPNKVG